VEAAHSPRRTSHTTPCDKPTTRATTRQALPTIGRAPGAHRRLRTDSWLCNSSNAHQQPIDGRGRRDDLCALRPTTSQCTIPARVGGCATVRGQVVEDVPVPQVRACESSSVCKWTHSCVRFATEAAGQCKVSVTAAPGITRFRLPPCVFPRPSLLPLLSVLSPTLSPPS
jgi:hypothetical protein